LGNYNDRGKTLPKPGDADVNGHAIPHYIIHGGTEVADSHGLSYALCQFIDQPTTSVVHERNRQAMFARWEKAGAKHVYPKDED
jgi:hypothetical protein